MADPRAWLCEDKGPPRYIRHSYNAHLLGVGLETSAPSQEGQVCQEALQSGKLVSGSDSRSAARPRAEITLLRSKSMVAPSHLQHVNISLLTAS
jgi:hypothetical protein